MSEKKKYHRGRKKSKERPPLKNDEKTAAEHRHAAERKDDQSEKDHRISQGTSARWSVTRAGRYVGMAVMCLLVILLMQTASAKGESTAQILIATQNEEIFADESVPKPEVIVECPEEQQQIMLDKSTGYQVKDLVAALQKGEGYEILCDSDGTLEGKYEIEVQLTDVFRKDLDSRLKGKIYLTVNDGTLTVKNKVGDWDGKKFKKYDGSYVKNEFVTYRKESYYFGEDGEMVTGWQDIYDSKYHFTDKGVMERSVWKERKKGKSYLGDDGALTVGWLDLDDDVYYFDENGMMVTGKHKIGASKCEFGDDGKLISKKITLDPNKPMMALTFDDGPGERTMELLDVLEKYDAHATFFMQGKNVKSYKKEIQKMYEIGCELGNHSYDHPQLTKCEDGGADQIGTTNQLLKEVCGHSATVLRPPYGDYNDVVGQSVGMPMILWNVDTLDWKTMSTQATIDTVLSSADDGDIVLMHDIHSPTVDAAIKLIPKLITEGYQLVTVSELADARGEVLKNGVAYTDFNASSDSSD